MIITSNSSEKLGLISSLKIAKVITLNSRINNIEMIGFALYGVPDVNLPIAFANTTAGNEPVLKAYLDNRMENI